MYKNNKGKHRRASLTGTQELEETFFKIDNNIHECYFPSNKEIGKHPRLFFNK